MWAKNATTFAGSPVGIWGAGPILLNGPSDVSIDDNNNIYVLDAYSYRVQRWLEGEIVGTTAIQGSSGFELDQFSYMAKMEIDSAGNIYILDSGNMRVTKWEPGAVMGSVVVGGNGAGPADTNNHRIVKWSTPSTGEVVYPNYALDADRLSTPCGLFVDESDSNTLYIADTGNHRIQRLTTNATSAITVAGITGVYGKGLNQLYVPQTLIVDTEQNMFIVDTGNHRIMRWKIGLSSGEIIGGDTTDGVLTYQLFRPLAISFDSDGALFVLDAGNNRLQKFAVSCSPTNRTTTTRTTRLFTTTTSVTVTSSTTTSTSSTRSSTASPMLMATTSSTMVPTIHSTTTTANCISVINTDFYPKLLPIFLGLAIIRFNH